ncbi:MAG: hypothetical protein JWQ71_1274 [Pedosphaera sp.]|nr:hypothetical protein [Pedosphaera sp.]
MSRKLNHDDAAELPLHARNPLARFQVIMGELIRSKTTAKRLAKQLEVGPKTIYRDLDCLRYFLNVPIEATPEGFQLTEPVKLCAICSAAAKVDAVPTYPLAAPLERYVTPHIPKKAPNFMEVAAERARLLEAAELMRARVAI